MNFIGSKKNVEIAVNDKMVWCAPNITKIDLKRTLSGASTQSDGDSPSA